MHSFRERIGRHYANAGYTSSGDAMPAELPLGETAKIAKAATAWAKRHPDPCSPWRKSPANKKPPTPPSTQ